MAKALLTLPNGAKVTIEGSAEEVRDLLAGYSEPTSRNGGRRGKARAQFPEQIEELPEEDTAIESSVDLHQIVNQVKSCKEAEAIEEQILDRSSQVDRILLPLYIVHEYLKDRFTMSSGDISKVTRELGVPVSQPNASKALSSVASRYVEGDSVRKKGRPVKYKLNRRGVDYLKSVISGSSNED